MKTSTEGAYYNDIWMDNELEVLFAKKLDKLKINWTRGNNRFLTYIDKHHRRQRYYPDFFLIDYNLHIEIKYLSSRDLNTILKLLEQQNPERFKIVKTKKEIKDFKI